MFPNFHNYHLIHSIKWYDEFLKMKIEKVSWEASHKSFLDELNEVKNEQTMHDQIDFS